MDVNLKGYKLIKPSSIKKTKNKDALFFTDIEVKNANSFFIVNDNDLILSHNCDGDNITSLLINFLASNWIELFKQGKVFRVLTPLLIINDGKKKYDIYSENEYNQFIKDNPNKIIQTAFKKGLGALSDSNYSQMMQKPKLLKITFDESYNESLDNWFGNDSNKRKKLLLNKNF